MIAWYGNRMPKAVVPDACARQATRVGGWSMALSGLVYAGLWAQSPMWSPVLSDSHFVRHPLLCSEWQASHLRPQPPAGPPPFLSVPRLHDPDGRGLRRYLSRGFDQHLQCVRARPAVADGDTDQRLAAIESVDSDKEGDSNLVEITQNAGPAGVSLPPPAATITRARRRRPWHCWIRLQCRTSRRSPTPAVRTRLPSVRP